MNLTPQQLAFTTALRTTTGSIALIARAGTGKSTTIIYGVTAQVEVNPAAEIFVCAYNTAIAKEMKGKLIEAGHTNWKQVGAGTVHSLGNGLLTYAFHPEIDEDKVRKLVWAIQDNPTPALPWMPQIASDYSSQINMLVRLAKQEGVGYFDDRAISADSTWLSMIDHYGVDGLDDPMHLQQVLVVCKQVYNESLQMLNVIDFDDMILLPLIRNMRVRFQKDVIFVDEAQDLSRTRQALIRKFVKPDGRLVIVGDDRQAIYGFSGADATALDRMIAATDAMVLPLTTTWRCPRKVVELAQRIVPDLQAAPNAIDGEVVYTKSLPEKLVPGTDAVLCRNTAPLVRIAYSLIRAGIPAKVEGRNIGDGLKALALRWKVKTTDALLNRLADYEAREVQKAQAKQNDSKVEEVQDRVGTLREIIAAVNLQGGTRVDDVASFIDRLFADGAQHVVTLATYHRSKGREWNNVYLIEHAQRCPSKAARQPWQRKQEDNLAYVAITRAKQTLVFVEALDG